jgi:UDP-3-O-[3-hydroxymyristoyl] glucosamine N-acyltransferase
MRLSELAAQLGAELRDSESDSSMIDITGVAAPPLADATQLIFAENESTLYDALASRAAAVLVNQQIASDHANEVGKPLLVVAQPKLAFACAARMLRPAERRSGVDPAALVASTATLAEDIWVGPGAVIEGRCCRRRRRAHG